MKSRPTSELIELVKKYLWTGEYVMRSSEERYLCYAIIECEEHERLTGDEKKIYLN